MDYKAIAIEAVKYSYIGVRSLCNDEQYEVGDDCRESYEWDFENDCSTYETDGELANGTCATAVEYSYDVDELATNIEKAVVQNAGYLGERQAVIVGSLANLNAALDDGEVRIIGAQVVAVFDK